MVRRNGWWANGMSNLAGEEYMGFLSSCGISQHGLFLVGCLWMVAGGIGLALFLGGYRFETGAGWQVVLDNYGGWGRPFGVLGLSVAF